MNFTWTDAGAVTIIFYIVVKLLREIRAFLEIKNNKTVTGTLDSLPIKMAPLPEHCRQCHTMMVELKTFLDDILEVGEKFIPLAMAKELEHIKLNQKAIMACQKSMLTNQAKIISDLVIMEEHCEGRYTGTKRAIGEVLKEVSRHKDTTVTATEILRLIKEHNLKSSKVIDAIMRKEKIT